MEISRLPPVSPGQPAGTAYNRASRPDPVDEAARASRASARAQETERVRVVEGELLHRQQGTYQSTRAFIDERAFDSSLAGQAQQDARGRARTAILQYLDHTPTATSAARAGVPNSINFYA